MSHMMHDSQVFKILFFGTLILKLKSFQTLANNKDLKKAIKDMQKLRTKRGKQIEGMLNQPLHELKKSYKNPAKR